MDTNINIFNSFDFPSLKKDTPPNKSEIIILPSSTRRFGGIYKKIKDIPNLDPTINIVSHLYLDDGDADSYAYYYYKEYYQPQDIYIINNSKIIKDNYYFDGFKIKKYINEDIQPNFNKVIATSNISLDLPILPDSFNKEFIWLHNIGKIPTEAYYDVIKNYITINEFNNKRHFFTEK